MVQMTNDEFIKSIRERLIPFQKGKGFPVGEHLIIIDGYWIYNRHLKTPLIKVPFHSIIDAYKTCLKLEEIYGDLLHILVDKDYAPNFFQLTRYTINEEFADKFMSFEHKLQRTDLGFILD